MSNPTKDESMESNAKPVRTVNAYWKGSRILVDHNPDAVKDWVILAYIDNGPGHHYRHTIVDGFNHSTNENMYWSVPDLFDNPRYDMSNAELVAK